MVSPSAWQGSSSHHVNKREIQPRDVLRGENERACWNCWQASRMAGALGSLRCRGDCAGSLLCRPIHKDKQRRVYKRALQQQQPVLLCRESGKWHARTGLRLWLTQCHCGDCRIGFKKALWPWCNWELRSCANALVTRCDCHSNDWV